MTGGSTRSNTSSGASSTLGKPGTSAKPTPVSTRRIAGGILRRMAMTATAATTTSSNTTIWIVGIMRAPIGDEDRRTDPPAYRDSTACSRRKRFRRTAPSIGGWGGRSPSQSSWPVRSGLDRRFAAPQGDNDRHRGDPGDHGQPGPGQHPSRDRAEAVGEKAADLAPGGVGHPLASGSAHQSAGQRKYDADQRGRKNDGVDARRTHLPRGNALNSHPDRGEQNQRIERKAFSRSASDGQNERKYAEPENLDQQQSSNRP